MSRTARFVQFAAVSWLGALVFPLGETITSDSSADALLVVLSLVAAFTAIYVWFWFGAFPAGARRSLVAASTALTLMASVLNLEFALEARWGLLFGFVVVAWGFSLPPRAGMLGVAGATLAGFATVVAMRPGLSPDRQSEFPMLLGSGTLQLLLLGLGAIAVNNLIATESALRTARQELARLAVEEERLRFARDLHDLLGHSLSLIVLKSELAGRLLSDHLQPALAEVRDIEAVARTALGEVREAVAGYRRPTLAAAVANAQTTLSAAGVDCQVVGGVGPIPADVEAVCAWAVREGTTNVVRHSRARHCLIRLAADPGTACVEICDDGLSARQHSVAYGSGLLGLSERVAAHGGQLEARSLADGGFRLRLEVPLAVGDSVEGT